jgi:hypothetical protein
MSYSNAIMIMSGRPYKVFAKTNGVILVLITLYIHGTKTQER